ncbi:MAG: ATP-binding protein [Methylococcales bacterium]
MREAVINAIIHGNKNAEDKQVDVKFVTDENTLTASVRDRGEGFDPPSLPAGSPRSGKICSIPDEEEAVYSFGWIGI